MNNARILTTALTILQYEGQDLPAESKKQWELIRDDLTGSDFSSVARRYVGMDLLEDQIDEEGNQVDRVQPHLESLAKQSVDDPGLLEPELHWMVTKEAPNGFRFGYELGKCDTDALWLPKLLDAQKKIAEAGVLYFLGGYLRAQRELGQEAWEQLADELASDQQNVGLDTGTDSQVGGHVGASSTTDLGPGSRGRNPGYPTEDVRLCWVGTRDERGSVREMDGKAPDEFGHLGGRHRS